MSQEDILHRLQKDVAENASKLRRLRTLLGSMQTAQDRTLEQLASNDTARKGKSPASLDFTSETAQAPRALVADDDHIIQVLLSALLLDEGFEVHSASNGAEAVQAAKDFEPDLIFMDYEMPRLNGAEATRSIRSEIEHGKQPFIIAFTSADRDDVRAKFDAAGADHFLAKPFNQATIRTLLDRWRAVVTA
jgi:CheY-like chemotaxis protein